MTPQLGHGWGLGLPECLPLEVIGGQFNEVILLEMLHEINDSQRTWKKKTLLIF